MGTGNIKRNHRMGNNTPEYQHEKNTLIFQHITHYTHYGKFPKRLQR